MGIFTLDIIGSCVNRDVFNENFVSMHKEYFKINSYFPRIPIPALVSDAIDYDMEVAIKESATPWFFECL